MVPVALEDLANGGWALVWPGVLHCMVPVALEDPDLETWYWGGPVWHREVPVTLRTRGTEDFAMVRPLYDTERSQWLSEELEPGDLCTWSVIYFCTLHRLNAGNCKCYTARLAPVSDLSIQPACFREDPRKSAMAGNFLKSSWLWRGYCKEICRWAPTSSHIP